MNKTRHPSPRALTRFPQRGFAIAILSAFILILAIRSANAQSATWNSNPTSSDWNTAENWTPAVVPSDTATFGLSSTTDIFVSQDLTSVGRIFFAPGASAYTIAPLAGSSLVISGVGVTNWSGVEQNFLLGPDGGEIIFSGSAAARGLTTFTVSTTSLQFHDDSSAAVVLIENLGGTASAPGGFVGFYDRSNARLREQRPTINNYGGEINGGRGGWTSFDDDSSAGQAFITCEGATVRGALGGLVQFTGSAHAGSATLIANRGENGGGGGVIQFLDQSVGEQCEVTLSGNGTLDLSLRTGTGGVEIASLASSYGNGFGIVNLGNSQLSVGGNDLRQLFQGLIQDGPNASGGSLRKTGSRNFVLTSGNTYTGGTTIDEGALVVINTEGSATGTGPVRVDAGQLGGNGFIAGPVTVGASDSVGAFLWLGAGEDRRSRTLTIGGPLSLTTNSTYHWNIFFQYLSGDTVVANGVSIEDNAFFLWSEHGFKRRRFPVGYVLNVITNTSATPITGTFANMPDGTIFLKRVNKFQVNYHGGDGNDLTLTVVE